MLAIHPKVQDELYREIQEICGNQLPSFTDIPNMIYSMCIMYEVMRIFPVIGTLPTRTEEDQILLGKHLIPKNTCVGIDLVSLHSIKFDAPAKTYADAVKNPITAAQLYRHQEQQRIREQRIQSIIVLNTSETNEKTQQ